MAEMSQDLKKVYQEFKKTYGDDGTKYFYRWVREHGYNLKEPIAKQEEVSRIHAEEISKEIDEIKNQWETLTNLNMSQPSQHGEIHIFFEEAVCNIHNKSVKEHSKTELDDDVKLLNKLKDIIDLASKIEMRGLKEPEEPDETKDIDVDKKIVEKEKVVEKEPDEDTEVVEEKVKVKEKEKPKNRELPKVPADQSKLPKEKTIEELLGNDLSAKMIKTISFVANNMFRASTPVSNTGIYYQPAPTGNPIYTTYTPYPMAPSDAPLTEPKLKSDKVIAELNWFNKAIDELKNVTDNFEAFLIKYHYNNEDVTKEWKKFAEAFEKWTKFQKGADNLIKDIEAYLKKTDFEFKASSGDPWEPKYSPHDRPVEGEYPPGEAELRKIPVEKYPHWQIPKGGQKKPTMHYLRSLPEKPHGDPRKLVPYEKETKRQEYVIPLKQVKELIEANPAIMLQSVIPVERKGNEYVEIENPSKDVFNNPEQLVRAVFYVVASKQDLANMLADRNLNIINFKAKTADESVWEITFTLNKSYAPSLALLASYPQGMPSPVAHMEQTYPQGMSRPTAHEEKDKPKEKSKEPDRKHPGMVLTAPPDVEEKMKSLSIFREECPVCHEELDEVEKAEEHLKKHEEDLERGEFGDRGPSSQGAKYPTHIEEKEEAGKAGPHTGGGKHISFKKLVEKLRRRGYSKESAERIAATIGRRAGHHKMEEGEYCEECMEEEIAELSEEIDELLSDGKKEDEDWLKKVEEEIKKGQNNPWAICTASVGRDDVEKYERCVRHVKKRLGIS